MNVIVTYDGSSQAGGLKMYFDGAPTTTTIVRDHLDKAIVADIFRVGARPRDDRGFTEGQLDELSIFRHALTPVEVADLAGVSLAATFQSAKAGDAAAKAKVKEFFMTHFDPELIAARKALTDATRDLHDNYLDHIPLIMCMEETKYPRKFYVHERGDYTSPILAKEVNPAPILTRGIP